MVEIKDLCKNYGNLTALDRLNLKIKKGELFGFVGPNGAGKTTVLKMMAGLLPADSGEITVAGIDAIRDASHLKKQIGYVPDFFGVYDNFKVMEYMEFYASAYGITGENARMLCRELLELVHLEDKKDFMVDSLSRGMKQRLCLARSLVHDPKLLILDEPVSGLDPRARLEMKNTLRQLNEQGKTIIISSHILSEMSELCTTIGIIEQGKMAAKGTIEEITHQINALMPIVVEIAGERKKALQVLKECPEVKNISMNGERFVLGFSGNTQQQAAVLRQLVEEGVPVISFQKKNSDLETIFMKVTEENGGK